mmetsp:Transcript_42029/g.57333  ORF Transcript_42029/g.57333 Transcript_42029/m.57333 type:complete len:92 (-) Transcript_42029:156-431(-)
MEEHKNELERMFPKESGRAGRIQSSRAQYALNRAYAENADSGSVMAISDSALYGDDGAPTPMDAKRARAAASNARVMAMVEAARARRALQA